jgi:hypothetical protein
MPELPEVEVIRRDLVRRVEGRRIQSARIAEPRLTRRRGTWGGSGGSARLYGPAARSSSPSGETVWSSPDDYQLFVGDDGFRPTAHRPPGLQRGRSHTAISGSSVRCSFCPGEEQIRLAEPPGSEFTAAALAHAKPTLKQPPEERSASGTSTRTRHSSGRASDTRRRFACRRRFDPPTGHPLVLLGIAIE